jgi:hypothetical protein
MMPQMESSVAWGTNTRKSSTFSSKPQISYLACACSHKISQLDEAMAKNNPEPHATNWRSGYPRRRGKQSGGRNAAKIGNFGPMLLIEKEEAFELYEELLQALIRELNPVGTLEFTIVEKLAVNIWRQRRMIMAERAEINEATARDVMAIKNAMHEEAWDVIRTADQILRNESNPIVLKHAITYLKDSRELVEKNAVQPGQDPWRLRELYGLVQGRFVPPGLYEDYVRFCRLISETEKLKQAGVTVDELKKAMLAAFDETINFLDFYQSWLLYLQLQRFEWAMQSAMVPDSSDRLIRYEGHLSQEFDSLQRQLERLQRRRLQLSSEFST